MVSCLKLWYAKTSVDRPDSEDSKSNARLFFQRINVKTFFTLLQILLVELERSVVVEDPGNDKDAKSSPEKVTVVARRILPALRHYSSWLLTVSPLLVAYKEKDTPLSVQITEFWKIYANTLTLLALTFEVVNLPDIDYLLEEDEETLGFAPLDQEATSRRYLDTNGKFKPRMHDQGVERSHPNIEMLYRVREFVIDGLDLVVGNVWTKTVTHAILPDLLTQTRKSQSLLWMTMRRRASSTRKKVFRPNSSPVHLTMPILFRPQTSSGKTSSTP